MTDLERAKQILDEEELSCVLVRGDAQVRCNERGIRSLLGLIGTHGRLEGYSAADRIVGKAAALMYSILGVGAVYAQVLSEAGKDALEKHGIEASWGTLTPMIVNRKGDGSCPMEQTVEKIEDPQEAYLALCEKTGLSAR